MMKNKLEQNLGGVWCYASEENYGKLVELGYKHYLGISFEEMRSSDYYYNDDIFVLENISDDDFNWTYHTRKDEYKQIHLVDGRFQYVEDVQEPELKDIELTPSQKEDLEQLGIDKQELREELKIPNPVEGIFRDEDKQELKQAVQEVSTKAQSFIDQGIQPPTDFEAEILMVKEHDGEKQYIGYIVDDSGDYIGCTWFNDLSCAIFCSQDIGDRYDLTWLPRYIKTVTYYDDKTDTQYVVESKNVNEAEFLEATKECVDV